METTAPISATPAANVPAVVAAPPTPPAAVRLLQWFDVPTAELQPYAPTDNTLPMLQYAVQTVMAWGQAQPNAVGAIPTCEVSTSTWGVVLLYANPGISTVDVPQSAFSTGDLNPTVDWCVGVAEWATQNNYQLGIPTFTQTDTARQALVFDQTYPAFTFIDAPNAALFGAMFEARSLLDLTNPAVWAQASMRLATGRGFGAGWPTWQWNTSRGLLAMAEYAPLPLPEPTDESVKSVVKVLDKMSTTLNFIEADLGGSIVGVFSEDTQPPVTDPGLRIGLTILFDAITAGLNLVPEVGGVLSSLVGDGLTAALNSTAAQNTGPGSLTLADYQTNMVAAFNDAINAVDQAQQNLLAATTPAELQAAWSAVLSNPLTGQSAPVGLLAYGDPKQVLEDQYWDQARESTDAAFLNALKQTIVQPLYYAIHRTYSNSTAFTQRWDGTPAEVAAPGGVIAQYIIDGDDNWSCWFTNLVPDGSSHTASDEFWLQSQDESLMPEYPASDLITHLFTSDGCGDTTGWSGPFTQSQLYTSWPIQCCEHGSSGFQQTWTYNTSTNLVTATMTGPNEFGQELTGVVGSTDAYGRVTLANPDELQTNGSGTSGFSQHIIQNYLNYLN